MVNLIMMNLLLNPSRNDGEEEDQGVVQEAQEEEDQEVVQEAEEEDQVVQGSRSSSGSRRGRPRSRSRARSRSRSRPRSQASSNSGQGIDDVTPIAPRRRSRSRSRSRSSTDSATILERRLAALMGDENPQPVTREDPLILPDDELMRRFEALRNPRSVRRSLFQ